MSNGQNIMIADDCHGTAQFAVQLMLTLEKYGLSLAEDVTLIDISVVRSACLAERTITVSLTRSSEVSSTCFHVMATQEITK